MRRTIIISAVLLLAALYFCLPVSAGETYESVYAEAFDDASARHVRMYNNNEIVDPYDEISYALSDLTADGLYELIIRQVTGKHYAEYWVYGCNGYDSYYMGQFGCDAYLMYGFQSGVLYRENYKGSVSLGLAEWTGDGFTTTILYNGTYDREGDPPSIWDLSDYYDPGRLLARIPDFVPLGEDVPALYETCGGSAGSTDRFNLSNYAYRTVKTDNSKGALVFQTAPNGSFMNDYQFWNGDSIYVNLDWRQDGYAIAYENGEYGYVDAKYINWDSASSSGGDGRFDFSNYAHRTVKTDNAKGALVFQNAPNGAFMNSYQFWNGDDIYVNLNWRQDGYAIAYKNGVYGYVDANYINW